MLVQIENRIVNTDHIVSAAPAAGARDEMRSILKMSDGTTIPVSGEKVCLEDLCGVIVPAHPGFVLIEAFLPSRGEKDRSVHYRESMVIAFRIIGGTQPLRPIAVSGEPLDRSDVSWAVRQPDGQCSDAEGVAVTIEDFKATCRELVAERSRKSA